MATRVTRFGAAAAVAALCARGALALNNGLGATPGLGWNSDYCLNCASAQRDASGVIRGFQNDAYVRHIADFLVTSGLAAMGYRYVNMDAAWDTFERDAQGNLVPDPALWPGGNMTATIDYVHSLGLGFGLYGDRGTLDCSKRPGQLGHEAQDAAMFAQWGVDWYKSDSCNAPSGQAEALAEYAVLRDALNKTGRPMWFALCGWEPWYAPPGQSLANSWRIGADTGSGWAAVMSNVNAMLALAPYAGPTPGGGGWNDMSLLLLPGMGSGPNTITPARHRAQFTLHCVFAANMLLTGNLSDVDPFVLETWGNPEAVAVNQDPGYQPFVVLPPAPAPAPAAAAAAGGLGYTPASVAECGGEPSLQNWTFGAPAALFLTNAASESCLNVDACATDIIFDGCTTTGATCSGPGKYYNEQWTLTPQGGLVSSLPGGRCATVGADRTLALAPCGSPLPPNQTWTYTPSTGALAVGGAGTGGGGGLCLTAAQPTPPPGADTLLVGRRLSDGSWAVAALNNGANDTVVTCGGECFAALGVPPTQLLRVRDLWARADVNVTQAQALPIPVAGGGAAAFLRLTPIACVDDGDCQLNGVCEPASGTCACDPGWGGATCGVLNLAPAGRGQGTCDPSLNGTATGFTTTWGGNPMRDAATGTWHMFVAEMALHCGMRAWGSQSQVAHYTAPGMLGPYARAGLAVGPFSHNPVVVEVPPGTAGPGIGYVMMHIGLGCNSVGPHACNYSAMPSCANGTTPGGTVPTGSDEPVPPGLHWGETHVAASLDGEWLPMPSGWTVPRCVNNPAPLFLPNGSLMILCHEPFAGAPASCPGSGGLWQATSLTANWTHGAYAVQCLHLLNPTLVAGPTTYTAANEDPHLYADGRGNLHAITHNQGPGYLNLSWFGGDVRGDAGHFFSADGGATWRFSWHSVYSGLVSYLPSEPLVSESEVGLPAVQVRYKRERPKLVQDPVTLAPIALANGASQALVDAFAAGDDAACTLVVAVDAVPPVVSAA